MKKSKRNNVNKKKLHHILVIDKSGSMTGVVKETVGNINEQINIIKEESKKNDIESYVTLMLFDGAPFGADKNDFEYLFVGKNSKDLKNITEDDYQPRGSTPLCDAIADGVKTLTENIGDELGNDNVKVLVTIFTDGAENTSTEHNSDSIKKMISHLSENGKWIFTFMGCGGIDEVNNVARTYGIDVSNTVSYENSVKGHIVAGSTLCSATSTFYTNYAEDKRGLVSDFFGDTELRKLNEKEKVN